MTPATVGSHASGTGSRFTELQVGTRYSSADDLIDEFYVPVLSRAVTYDRVAGYFSSSSFVTAAAGLARFVANEGTVRLLVGAQLTNADRDALLGNVPLDEVLKQRLLRGMVLDADEIVRRRFEVIAWLVNAGRLEIKVGVPCDADGVPLAGSDASGYFHPKFGIVTDVRGDRIVFAGSINESDAGWRRNFEAFSVYPSWKAEVWEDYGKPYQEEFAQLWHGEGVGPWTTVELPTAVREKLLDLVPNYAHWRPAERDPLESLTPDEREVVDQIKAAPRTCTGVGLVSADVTPWPHQMRIARRIVETWPRSYVLADEVGLGKTIETGLVLRELLLSARATTALILVPASVLIQWQEEMAEKFLLDVPRLQGRTLYWSDPERPPEEIPAGTNRWRAAHVLLASSHLARRRSNRHELIEGDGWDLVVLDEAHHARRRGARPTDAPNTMLATLSELHQHGKWQALLMASATPMQLHSHDLWDLLALCGLPSKWDCGAGGLERYYAALLEPFNERPWTFLRDMLQGHFASVEPDTAMTHLLRDDLGWVAANRITRFHMIGLDPRRLGEIPSEEHPYWDRWLRANTPVRDRVFRTTRSTLLRYRTDGVLPSDTVIPERRIDDEFLPLDEARAIYDRIEDYIVRHYDAYMQAGGASKPLGFIMTVYRRRLTSSFHAIRCSLERRRDVLAGRRELLELLDEDDNFSLEAVPEFDDLEAVSLTAAGIDLDAELTELDDFIDDLSSMPPDEPKMARLHELLEESLSGGHRTVVVFTQYADTLQYVREQLLSVYGTQLICYYGGRGERWVSRPGSEGDGRWDQLSKEEVKDLFRRGDAVRILLGTDSMSEGLNLQTCDRLINFDLPWNFMRVEQRIGRVDRIGGKPLIEVTNLFYEDTVEDDIYRRIRDRHDWFTNVVGNAQPVLAAAEPMIEQVAMGRTTVDDAVEDLTCVIDQLATAPITTSDLDSVPQPESDLSPAMDLDGLRDALLSVSEVRSRLHPHPDHADAWLLEVGGAKHGVTFDRDRHGQTVGLTLLTWGSPLLNAILEEL